MRTGESTVFPRGATGQYITAASGCNLANMRRTDLIANTSSRTPLPEAGSEAVGI